MNNKMVKYVNKCLNYNDDLADEVTDYLDDLGYSYRDNQWTINGALVDSNILQEDIDEAITNVKNN